MQAITLSRYLTLLAYFGLLLLTMLWVSVFSPSPRLPVSIMLLVFAGPLLLPLRGLLYGKTFTHTWTTFLALLYFVHGVVEAWASPTERNLALIEVVLSILLFCGCFFYVRFSHKQN